MKKIVTILLSIMMILALAACNSSSTPTPNGLLFQNRDQVLFRIDTL